MVPRPPPVRDTSRRMRRAALVVLVGVLAFLPQPTAASGPSTSFQADPAHTGFVSEPGLSPPLRRAWTQRFPAEMSYPIIAEGKVFVTAAKPHGRGSQVFALSARTGRIRWRVDLGSRGGADAAYDDGRLYVSRPNHPDFPARSSLLALSAADGRVLWEAALISGAAPPVAAGGAVYISGQHFLYAFRGT